jgi:hypothetical protein
MEMGFGDLVGKAKDLAQQNADKVESAVEKAGDIVDEKTGGKYESVVNKVQDAAKKVTER